MNKSAFSKIFTVVLAAAIILSLTACSSGNKLKSGSKEVLTLSNTDYANMNNWLSFGGDDSKKVDVFMIYPTVTQSMDDADRPYVRIDNPMMRRVASGWLMANGELASEAANIYAPFYRQLNGVELNDLDSEAFETYTCGIPRDDVFSAFDYYLTNVNKGERPFILLGHSQGAQLVIEIATTFLGNEKYYTHNKNHIITYAIGCSVTQSQIEKNPNLKFSQSKDDVGVMVSWNTTAPSEIESGAYKIFGTWKQGALITNPITWNTSETPAKASDNRASMVVDFDASPIAPGDAFKMVEAFTGATADNKHNLLVAADVDEAKYPSMSPKISKYHGHDIPFYYESIKQNVANRINAFTSK